MEAILILKVLDVVIGLLEAHGMLSAGEAQELQGIFDQVVNEGRDLTAEEAARVDAFVAAQRAKLHG